MSECRIKLGDIILSDGFSNLTSGPITMTDSQVTIGSVEGVADQLDQLDQNRLEKNIWTENESGEKISVNRLLTDGEEGRFVASSIFELKMQYQLKNNVVSFSFPNGYNKNYDLVIDPELVFSTYSGSLADNFGYTAYRSIFDDRFNIHGYGNYAKSLNIIMSNCYKDKLECFDMKEAYMTSMVERETMNQFREAVKARPKEILDENIEKALGNIEEEKKKIEEVTNEIREKTNAQVLSTLDTIIDANKAKTEWVKSYQEKAKSLKDKAKDLLNK